jgi:hypothetical protein
VGMKSMFGGGSGGSSSLVIGAGATPISGGAAGLLLFDTGTTISETTGLTWSSANKTLTMSGSSVSGASAPLLDLVQTWGTAVAYTAIKLNVTPGSASASSKLLDLQAAASSKFSVNLAGDIANLGGITAGTYISMPATGTLIWSARARQVSGVDGQITIMDSLATSLGTIALNLGLATSAAARIERQGTALFAKLGDGSALTTFQAIHKFDTAVVLTPTVNSGYITAQDSTGATIKLLTG